MKYLSHLKLKQNLSGIWKGWLGYDNSFRSPSFLCVNRAAQDWNLDAVTEEVEREYLNTLLKRLGNNQCAVAANLGMHRNTLNRRLKKLKIEIQGQIKQRKPDELLVSAGKVRGLNDQARA